jgi:hypothetical protein
VRLQRFLAPSGATLSENKSVGMISFIFRLFCCWLPFFEFLAPIRSRSYILDIRVLRLGSSPFSNSCE